MKPQVSIDDVCHYLDTCSSRSEAEAYLADMKMRKSELQQVASKFAVPYSASDNMTKIRTKIVEGTVGARLKFDALLHTL